VARLPRLALAGRAHYVILRTLPGVPAAVDDEDRAALLAALHEAFAQHGVALHAWSLRADRVELLATPPEPAALGLAMQALGRRYVAAYNRRHGRRGPLWDGRFRAAPVEPGAAVLRVLRLVDGAAAEGHAAAAPWSSAAHRTGARRDPRLVDPPEFWALGNTPFDREAAYARLLAATVAADEAAAARSAALGGWALGSPGFAAEVAAATARPARPRPRGRPARQPR
jgi:putative transposase